MPTTALREMSLLRCMADLVWEIGENEGLSSKQRRRKKRPVIIRITTLSFLVNEQVGGKHRRLAQGIPWRDENENTSGRRLGFRLTPCIVGKSWKSIRYTFEVKLDVLRLWAVFNLKDLHSVENSH